MHVREAAERLRSVCDGAIADDGQGFNKFDRPKVDRLLEVEMTEKQAEWLLQILNKYKGQFEDVGVEVPLDATPERVVENPRENQKHSIIVHEFKGQKKLAAKLVYGSADFWTVKDTVKSSCWYFADDKLWICKNGFDTEFLKAIKGNKDIFEITPDAVELIKDLVEEKKDETARLEASEKSNSNFEFNKFGRGDDLYPFQKAGCEYAISNDVNVLFADEMGLGKSVQSIASVYETGRIPCLVICPARLKVNWKNEIRKWLPDSKILIYDAADKSKLNELKGYDFVIVNYDILVKKFIGDDGGLKAGFVRIGFKSLVIDESHYCKNRKAKRTKAVREISSVIERKYLLTGTPILNRPNELLSQLEILGVREKFGSAWSFLKRYCGATHNGFGWDFSGASNLEELNEKLRRVCMVRRLKKDVLTELPEKQYMDIALPLADEERYRKVEDDIIHWLKEKYSGTELIEKVDRALRAETLTKINALKQVCAEEKLKYAIEWIRNFLDETGEKIVVFAHHRKIIEALADEFGDESVVLYGGTKGMDVVDEFQNDESKKVFIGSITAAGVGLTLTAASTAVFLEFAWNPGTMEQASDRIHRISQEADNVRIYYMLGDGTIDVELTGLIRKKAKIIAKAVGGEVPEEELKIQNEIVSVLLKKEN